MLFQLQTTVSSHRLLVIGFCLALLGALFPPTSTHLLGATLPQQPDLRVTSVVVNSKCSATFTITNVGTGATANPFTVQASPLAVGMLVPQTVTLVTIPSLAAGASFVHVRLNTKILNALAMTVVVDPQNVIAESDESNNTLLFPMPAKCRLLTPVTPVPTGIPE
jgi:subtilase family serine protease